MISHAKTYEVNQGVPDLHDQEPPPPPRLFIFSLGTWRKSTWAKDYERARKNEVRRRKEERVRDLVTSLNSLSGAMFAAIRVAERQIAILQDLHKMVLISCPPRQHSFYKSDSRIHILSEYPELVWSNILDTIDEMVRERKSFIEKIKELVENMDAKRKIV